MSGTPAPRAPGDRTGRRRLFLGGLFGLAGGVLGFVVPAALLLAAHFAPGAGDDPASVELGAIVAAAGLLFLCLVAYRSGFRALRSADRRFRIASTLCLVGSIGLLLLLAAAAYVSGSASDLAGCFTGAPGATVSCVRDHVPSTSVGGGLAVEFALAAFVLAWVGSLGLVFGLGWEARRIGSAALGASSALYALELLVLVGPIAGYLLALPAASDTVAALPFLGVLAPALAVVGTAR